MNRMNRMRASGVAAAMKRHLLFLVFAGTAFAQAPVRVDDSEARLHEIAAISFIRVPKPEGSGAIPFEVRVSTLGQIVAAKPVPGGREEYFEAAEKAVRSWQYKPFLRDGPPVEAIVWAWVFVLPEEIKSQVHKAFPQVLDWSTVKFKLIRTGCFGSCPDYEVEIRGDGTVTYSGRRDVAVTGVHSGSIAREQLESLMTGFIEADFFSFDAKYSLNATDGATYTTSLTIDGLEQTVVDYYGLEAGMPMAMTELERAVDWYAGGDKWIYGNKETVPALRGEGFDFQSQEAGRMLAHVARRGDANVVRALILAGVPLDVPTSGIFFQEKALSAAVSNPNAEVVRLLIEAGASKDDAKTKNEAAEMARDRPDVLAMLLKYGARIEASR
ncbi:MAG: ankyrin repeat domain-containing protein [Bryobacteraceae bacterium]